MSRRYSGTCPRCGAETLRFTVQQGDHMRVTGGPTVRVGVQGTIACSDYNCGYLDQSAWRDVTLEFGEAIR